MTQSDSSFFFFIKFMYLSGDSRESGEGAEREGEKIPSSVYTVSAESDVGLELTNHEIKT